MELLGKRIILRELDPPDKGLITADNKQFLFGAVEAIGEGIASKERYKDAKVLVSKYDCKELDWNGEKCFLTDEENIIGIE